MHSDAAELTGDELDYKQTAATLDCSVRTVHRLKSEGKLTPIVRRTLRGGKIVRFRRADVEALVAADAAHAATADPDAA